MCSDPRLCAAETLTSLSTRRRGDHRLRAGGCHVGGERRLRGDRRPDLGVRRGAGDQQGPRHQSGSRQPAVSGLASVPVPPLRPAALRGLRQARADHLGLSGLPLPLRLLLADPHGGKVYRPGRDPIKIVDEYEFLVDRYGVKQIGFIDPIFPLVKKDLEPFCNELVARGLDKKCQWLSETRADRLDPETCQMMYDGGCRRVLMGIESGVDMLLGNVNKKITTDKVRTGVENARNAGIQTVGLFMIGMPGETPEMTKETVEFAVELDLDFAKFAITVPFPGSKLFEDRWQKDLFRDDWENYTTFNPDPDRLIYHPHGYDPATLVKMQSWALGVGSTCDRGSQEAVLGAADHQSEDAPVRHLRHGRLGITCGKGSSIA